MRKMGVLVLSVLALAACQRKREPNKILDGYVVGASEVVLPAEAARQYCLLKRDMLQVIVPVINKLALDSSAFSELSGPVASKYSFQRNETHYGAVTFTLEFKHYNDTTIDPIDPITRGSSTTLKSVVVTCSGGSSMFPSITENLTLVLESSGVLTSNLRLYGASVLSGPGYTLNFGIDSSGLKALFEGVSAGVVSATGTGGMPPASTAINLAFGNDLNANGSIAWEGREGGIHIDNNGSGYVSTTAGRILFQ